MLFSNIKPTIFVLNITLIVFSDNLYFEYIFFYFTQNHFHRYISCIF